MNEPRQREEEVELDMPSGEDNQFAIFNAFCEDQDITGANNDYTFGFHTSLQIEVEFIALGMKNATSVSFVDHRGRQISHNYMRIYEELMKLKKKRVTYLTICILSHCSLEIKTESVSEQVSRFTTLKFDLQEGRQKVLHIDALDLFKMIEQFSATYVILIPFGCYTQRLDDLLARHKRNLQIPTSKICLRYCPGDYITGRNSLLKNNTPLLVSLLKKKLSQRDINQRKKDLQNVGIRIDEDNLVAGSLNHSEVEHLYEQSGRQRYKSMFFDLEKKQTLLKIKRQEMFRTTFGPLVYTGQLALKPSRRNPSILQKYRKMYGVLTSLKMRALGFHDDNFESGQMFITDKDIEIKGKFIDQKINGLTFITFFSQSKEKKKSHFWKFGYLQAIWNSKKIRYDIIRKKEPFLCFELFMNNFGEKICLQISKIVKKTEMLVITIEKNIKTLEKKSTCRILKEDGSLSRWISIVGSSKFQQIKNLPSNKDKILNKYQLQMIYSRAKSIGHRIKLQIYEKNVENGQLVNSHNYEEYESVLNIHGIDVMFQNFWQSSLKPDLEEDFNLSIDYCQFESKQQYVTIQLRGRRGKYLDLSKEWQYPGLLH